MQAFVNVAADVQQDFALAPHFRYYIREVRVVAYSQVSSWTMHKNVSLSRQLVTL